MKTEDQSRFVLKLRRCADDLRQQGVSALAEIYGLAAPRLVRYALTITRNQHDAEDALQAAMIRIVRRPRRLAAARHPWAYCLKIVRNEALRIIARKRPVVPASEAATAQWEISVSDLTEQNELIQRALNRLPREQAEVVGLKIWEGMTFAEIGLVSDVSPNTAASRYRYALEKLSTYLQPLNEETIHA